MILSYHPILEGDENRLCAGRDPDEADFRAMRGASAILLPQGCRESLFLAATRLCPHVFPDHTCCFLYPGKLGDTRLFGEYGVPHPPTWVFPSVEECNPSFLEELAYPVALKSNYGGEGSLVFRLENAAEATPILEMFRGMERSGFGGFLVQEWIPTDGRDLRVVVMGNRTVSYWRVQKDASNPYHNLGRGAVVDAESDPELQRIGVERVREFCRRTGINLAGLDLMFPNGTGGVCPEPLFLEINYFFGRKGLGGSDAYYQQLRQAVDEWLDETLTDR